MAIEKNAICSVDYTALLINGIYFNIKYIVWLFEDYYVTLQKSY